MRTDSGREFAAELTLTNTGGRELRDWTMSFTFPGQQTVTKSEPAAMHQEGSTVLVRPAAQRTTLAPGAAENSPSPGSTAGRTRCRSSSGSARRPAGCGCPGSPAVRRPRSPEQGGHHDEGPAEEGDGTRRLRWRRDEGQAAEASQGSGEVEGRGAWWGWSGKAGS
ncbi:cellulose binding domain-containing protein [Micromonospora sp. M12]